MVPYSLESFISHENLGRAFKSQFEVNVTSSDTTWNQLKFRVATVQFDNFQISNEYHEGIKRQLFSGFNPPKTMTVSAIEMIDYSSLNYLTDWVNKIYSGSRNVFILGTGKRRTIKVTADPLTTGGKFPIEIEAVGFPINTPLPSYDWGSGEPLKIESLTLAIDSLKITINGKIVYGGEDK